MENSKEDKKQQHRVLKSYDAEDLSIFIFEKIMHRMYWCRADLDILSDTLEKLVSSEVDRYEKHRVKFAKVKAHNARIARNTKKAAAVKHAAKEKRARAEKKNV